MIRQALHGPELAVALHYLHQARGVNAAGAAPATQATADGGGGTSAAASGGGSGSLHGAGGVQGSSSAAPAHIAAPLLQPGVANTGSLAAYTVKLGCWTATGSGIGSADSMIEECTLKRSSLGQLGDQML